jgi:hypothetical protein
LRLAVRALGPEHHAHAATPKDFAKNVRTDTIADGNAGRLDDIKRAQQHTPAVLGRGCLVSRVGGQQRSERVREFRIVLFDHPHQFGLLRGLHVDGLVEQCPEPLPLRGIDLIVHANWICGCLGRG